MSEDKLKEIKGILTSAGVTSSYMPELTAIQSELHAPKNQTNKFGGYKYRSCEDILEAVKPLLKKYKCHLTVSDEVRQVGDRVYIVANAKITNSLGQSEYVSAMAREAQNKKGMDDAQITGSSSSYARKYALNGLFCIDDTKDPDGTNTHGKDDEAMQERQALLIKFNDLWLKYSKQANDGQKAFQKDIANKTNYEIRNAITTINNSLKESNK